MNEFVMSPAIEWLEETFDLRQKAKRTAMLREYSEEFEAGLFQFDPILLNFKNDMCRCTEDNENDWCIALSSEGANSALPTGRISSIDGEIRRIAQLTQA